MEKLNKEQIDKALARLKELRKDPAYCGHLPHNMAMCYDMAPITYFEWEKVPGIWKCPFCGKEFGNGKPIESYKKSKYGRDFTDRDRGKYSRRDFVWSEQDDSDKNYYIEQNKFSSILNTLLDTKKYGYDVVLELHCLECITGKNKPPMVFKFKFDNAQDYTISYPTEKNIYEYATTLIFLKNLNPKVELKDVSAALKNAFSGMDYEGVSWNHIFNLLQRILGGVKYKEK